LLERWRRRRRRRRSSSRKKKKMEFFSCFVLDCLGETQRGLL